MKQTNKKTNKKLGYSFLFTFLKNNKKKTLKKRDYKTKFWGTDEARQGLNPRIPELEPSKLLILSPCLFNFYAEYIMTNAGLEEAQAGIKIARRNINNLR